MMLRALVLVSLCAVWLAGCGSNAPAPVEDRQSRSKAAPPRVAPAKEERYRVARGDTLYSIAFRYGLDFRGLAAANRIARPYTIYPGQQLVLREATPTSVSPVASAGPPAKKSTAPAQPKKAPTPAPSPRKAPTPAKAEREDFVGAPVTRWLWPSSGKVVRGFSSTRHKGISLAGNRGDPVKAVAAGKIVYAGTGIVGLGELLIVKHNEEYLSAYGHNDRLLVAEGDVVSAGQTIARKGNSGTDTVKLYFEIRRAGKPINPQRVLPKR